MTVRPLLFGSLLLTSRPLFAADLVPGSPSPDGRFALAYEQAQTRDADPPPRVWFVRLPSLTHAGAQLTPMDKELYRTERRQGGAVQVFRHPRTGARAEDRQMMFETLVAGAEARRQPGTAVARERGAADNYRVHWSADSRRVTLWAGAHKFTHASVYRLRRDGRFPLVRDYFTYAAPGSTP